MKFLFKMKLLFEAFVEFWKGLFLFSVVLFVIFSAIIALITYDIIRLWSEWARVH